MTREEVEEMIVESNPEALFLDGFDDAIIGIAERPNFGPVIAYSEEKIIEILSHQMEPSPEDLVDRTKDEVSLEMALEYYYFNVKSTWVGENTPIIITTAFY